MNIVFCHVRITTKAPDSALEVELDVDAEELESRFLEPYRLGRPIVISGRTITASELDRIQISETRYASDLVNKHIRARDARHNIVRSVDTRGQLHPSILAQYGVDVTRRYITGPPGYDAQAQDQPTSQVRPTANTRQVFVVHGRNLAASDALFDFLRAIDLHPLEWSEAVAATGKASPYIGEILDAAFSLARAVVVLLTPDDEARLRQQFWAQTESPHETLPGGQARPNVLFEAGMAMGRSESRTVLVELGTLRPFSDVAGRHVIRLDNSTQRRQELAQRLQRAGCSVSLGGSDWHSAGNFEAALLHTSNGGAKSTDTTRTPTYGGIVAISGDAANLLIEAMNSKLHVIQRLPSPSGTVIKANGKIFGGLDDLRTGTTWEAALKELVDFGLVVEDDTSEGEVFGVTSDGFELVDGFEFTQYMVQEEIERKLREPKDN